MRAGQVGICAIWKGMSLSVFFMAQGSDIKVGMVKLKPKLRAALVKLVVVEAEGVSHDCYSFSMFTLTPWLK